jgi:GNAT superfamily N-acetyltransferase
MNETTYDAPRVSADEAYAALDGMGKRLRQQHTVGMFRSDTTIEVFCSGTRLASWNGVFAPRVGATHLDIDEVAAGLDEIAATGLPYSLTSRASAREVLEPLAESRGLTLAEEIPLMVLDDLANAVLPEAPPELSMRRASVEDHRTYLRAAASAFETKYELARQAVPVAQLADSAQRYWLGTVGKSSVVATNVVLGDWVGLFNVGAHPEMRRRGYGTAVVAQALRDGLASGARHALLTSTPASYGVYTAMGFRAVERCPVWVSQEAA